MAFPCWDEPEFKAVFSISLTTNSELIRVSNEKVLSESSENNRTTTKFVDSMRMSTYLVAFVVGPLEVTKIGKSKTNRSWNSSQTRIYQSDCLRWGCCNKDSRFF